MVAFTVARLVVLAGSLLSMPLQARGSAFRGSSAPVALGHMNVEELRAAMLDELMSALGDGNRVTEGRLQAIEEALRPMFHAMSKNEHGNLDHSGVRYALHRLFVLRHGLFIKGLEPGGVGWSSSSPTEVLDDRVPAYVQGLFEKRLNGRGMGQHEVAILAVTLEHLFHDEATAKLKVAYSANSVLLEDAVTIQTAEEVIDTYMVMFLLGIDASNATSKAIRVQKETIAIVYPSWPESREFMRRVQREVVESRTAAKDPAFAGGRLTFNATALIVEEITERYGRWQDGECQSLKAALMGMEDRGSGRVLLKDFYGSAKGGAWQFTESPAYLRDLGALDESLPSSQGVIIPNYINSHSNCLASSTFFSVCCLNECEPLMGRLEREVGSPDAAPERLLDLVANLPSATVQAPREISAELRGLLQDIAQQHNGRVPLHGRLFGQWMHHAYPRECPYPHKSGTTNPMGVDEWTAERGEANAHLASADEMQKHIEAGNASCSADGAGCAGADAAASEPTPLMWTAEEELVVSTTSPPTLGGRRWRSCLLSSLMAAAALASLAATLWSSLRGALAALGPRPGYLLPVAGGKAHYC